MKYNIIYADPPWQFKTYSKRGSLKKSADCHYSCMDLEDIKALRVRHRSRRLYLVFVGDISLVKRGA